LFETAPKEGDEGTFWLHHSIVTAIVEKVYLDPRKDKLKENEMIQIYSMNNTDSDYGCPVLDEGDRYYLTLSDTYLVWPEWQPYYTVPYYRGMAEYYMSASSNYRRWRIDELNQVHVVPDALNLQSKGTVYEGSYWYDLIDNDLFESDIIGIMNQYQELWDNELWEEFTRYENALRDGYENARRENHE